MLANMQRSPSYWRLLSILVRRELVAKLTSFWFFAVATLLCVVALLYGSGFQHAFETESVLVTTDPLMPLNVTVVSIVGLVLGLRLATSLSWEREHQTLEVLLVGPVPWSAVVLAKFIVELCVMIGLLAIYIAYLLLGQPLGAGLIGLSDMGNMAAAPVSTLPLMATGLLVSAWARSVRGAVLFYFVAVAVLAGFEVLLTALKGAEITETSLISLYLRSGLETVAPFVTTISPVGQIASMIQSLQAEGGMSAPDQLLVISLTILLLASAYGVSRYRGARA